MRGSFYTPRESLIPKGAQKISDKLSDAVAYLYPAGNGKPAMMVFYGKQAKPVARFFYVDEASREAAVKRYFDARQQHNARNIERATPALPQGLADTISRNWARKRSRHSAPPWKNS
jgi:hypothetical protein